MTPERLYVDDCSEVWLGDCLNAKHVAAILGDRTPDLLCLDAPYSEKTHAGHDAGKLTADRMRAFAERHEDEPSRESTYARRRSALGAGRREINYAAWSGETIRDFCSLWCPRIDGWCVSITDDILAPEWRRILGEYGRYVFAPLPLVETGSRCRMAGDGPSAWTCWIVVARPKNAKFKAWGTLPGAYVQPAERNFNSASSGRAPGRVVGGKPLESMKAIVRDYSRPGALVIDPTCGGGTTLVAAKTQGRRCVGIDILPEHCELSARALSNARHQTAMPWAERGA